MRYNELTDDGLVVAKAAVTTTNSPIDHGLVARVTAITICPNQH